MTMTAKASPTEALKHNQDMIVKLARFMAFCMKSRIARGDINLVCQAGEKLAELNHYAQPSVGCLIEFLEKCDASQWLDFVRAGCGSNKRHFDGRYTRSDLLKILTGKSRQEWLDTEQKCCRHPDYRF